MMSEKRNLSELIMGTPGFEKYPKHLAVEIAKHLAKNRTFILPKVGDTYYEFERICTVGRDYEVPRVVGRITCEADCICWVITNTDCDARLRIAERTFKSEKEIKEVFFSRLGKDSFLTSRDAEAERSRLYTARRVAKFKRFIKGNS